MEFACAGGQNVLLVGPHGSGKTTMVNDFLNSQDPQAQILKKLVYSGSSTSRQLQQFIEANIYHRQGKCISDMSNVALPCLRLFISPVI